MFRGGGVARIDWLPVQVSEIGGVSLALLGRIGGFRRSDAVSIEGPFTAEEQTSVVVRVFGEAEA